MRYLLGGFSVLPLFFLFHTSVITRPILLKIAGLGSLFFALFPFMFSWGFVYTNAARGSLMLATMPIWAMLAGCVCILPFSVANGIYDKLTTLTFTQIGLLVYLGVVAGGLAFFLLNWTLTKTTATFTTIFVTLNPITAIVLGYSFLGEDIKLNFFMGVMVVFIGLGFAVSSENRGQHHKFKEV